MFWALAPLAVADVAWVLFDLGCHEISLGDTIGAGTPEQNKAMIEAVDRVDIAAADLPQLKADTKQLLQSML